MSALAFPRTLVHEGLSGGGAPLVVAGKVDDAVAAKIARFSFWCCQPGYLWSSQRFALDYIRARSDTKILGHFVAHSSWGAPSDALDNYQGRYAKICGGPNGPDLCDPIKLWACVDLWSEVVEAGGYAGLMIDPMCAVDGRGPLDAQRRALGSILATLRQRHPDKIIIGCGGPGGAYPGAYSANGWWFENVWEQNPVGWSPVTRLCMDGSYRYHAPVLNAIAMARSSVDPQAMRFGLGTSCLFDGVFTIGPGDFKGSAHLDWTIPEYFPAGWLGQPLGAPWPLNTTTWQRTFEHGEVAVSTLARDAVFKRY